MFDITQKTDKVFFFFFSRYLSLAGQQLNNSKIYENLLINTKVVYVLKKLRTILKLK